MNESIREIKFWEDNMKKTQKENLTKALKKVGQDNNVDVIYEKFRPLYGPAEDKKKATGENPMAKGN